VPAAAVIPAPIGYIKVVAVEKLVVVLLVSRRQQLFRRKSRLCADLSPFCGTM
jgi:hypothetical protein